MADSKRPLFLIHYRDVEQGSILSLKARCVFDSPLGLSFICLSEFVFDTQSLVIKPVEEQLRKRLEHVKKLHLSIYNVLSIEELSEHSLKFQEDKSKLIALPSSKPSLPDK